MCKQEIRLETSGSFFGDIDPEFPSLTERVLSLNVYGLYGVLAKHFHQLLLGTFSEGHPPAPITRTSLQTMQSFHLICGFTMFYNTPLVGIFRKGIPRQTQLDRLQTEDHLHVVSTCPT